jgi:hypothetical protein
VFSRSGTISDNFFVLRHLGVASLDSFGGNIYRAFDMFGSICILGARVNKDNFSRVKIFFGICQTDTRRFLAVFVIVSVAAAAVSAFATMAVFAVCVLVLTASGLFVIVDEL